MGLKILMSRALGFAQPKEEKAKGGSYCCVQHQCTAAEKLALAISWQYTILSLAKEGQWVKLQ